MFFKNKKKQRILPSGEKLKQFDIIYIDDRSFFNRTANLIRYVQTGGKLTQNYFCPNHCMLVIAEHPDIEQVTVMQSNWLGVNAKKLGIWLNHPKVNVVVKRYKGDLRYERKMKMWVKEQEGKWYDYPALAGIYGRYLVLRYSKSRLLRWYLKNKPNLLSSEKRLICSEFVLRAYLKARIHLIRGKHYTHGTPWDVFKSKKLDYLFKVSNFEYKKEKLHPKFIKDIKESLKSGESEPVKKK